MRAFSWNALMNENAVMSVPMDGRYGAAWWLAAGAWWLAAELQGIITNAADQDVERASGVGGITGVGFRSCNRFGDSPSNQSTRNHQ